MSQECDFEAMAAMANEHKLLKPFEGTFKSEVKMWMGPGDPMVSTGDMVNSFELDGRFLKQTYQGDPCDGPFPEFAGRGYWGFNTMTGEFEGMWIDNASTVMQTEKGSVDSSGKVWTMVGEMPGPDGSRMAKKSVITLIDDDHHKMEMFFAGPDGKETKGMEITYVRA